MELINLVNTIALINATLQKEVEVPIKELLLQYNFENKIVCRYEYHAMNGYYEIIYDTIIIEKLNEDDYGFTSSFKLYEIPSGIKIISDTGKSIGPYTLYPRELNYTSEKDVEIINEMILEKRNVTML